MHIGMPAMTRPAANHPNDGESPKRIKAGSEDITGMDQDEPDVQSPSSPGGMASPNEPVPNVPLFLKDGLPKEEFDKEVERIKIAMDDYQGCIYTFDQPHDVYLYGITTVSSTLKFLEVLGYKHLNDEAVDFDQVVAMFLEMRPEFENDDGGGGDGGGETPIPATIPIGMPLAGQQPDPSQQQPAKFTEPFTLESFTQKLMPFYNGIAKFKNTMVEWYKGSKTWIQVGQALMDLVCDNALLIASIITLLLDTEFASGLNDTIGELNKAAKNLRKSNLKMKFVEVTNFIKVMLKVLDKKVDPIEIAKDAAENASGEDYMVASQVLRDRTQVTIAGDFQVMGDMIKDLKTNGLGWHILQWEKKPYLAPKKGRLNFVTKQAWKLSYALGPWGKLGITFMSLFIDASARCLHENRDIMRVFLERNDLESLKIKINGKRNPSFQFTPELGIWQSALLYRFRPMKPNKPRSLRYNKTLGGNQGTFIKEPVPPKKKSNMSYDDQQDYERRVETYCRAKVVYDKQEDDVLARNSKYREAKNFYDAQWKAYQEELDALANKLKARFCAYAKMHKRLYEIFKVPKKKKKKGGKEPTVTDMVTEVASKAAVDAVERVVSPLLLIKRGMKADEVEKIRRDIVLIFKMLKEKTDEYPKENEARDDLTKTEMELNKFDLLNSADTSFLKAKYWPEPPQPGNARGRGAGGAAANPPNKLEEMQAYELNWKNHRPNKPIYTRRRLVLNVKECKKTSSNGGAVVAPQVGDDENEIDCGDIPTPVDDTADLLALLTIDGDNGGYESDADDAEDNDMFFEDDDEDDDDE